MGGDVVKTTADRVAMVHDLHSQGLSNRAIAGVVGIDHHSVARNLATLGLTSNSTRCLSAPERFWRFVNKDKDGCWEWAGGRNPEGYGCFKYRGRSIKASRYSYMLANNRFDMASTDLVCHHCDNPGCIRPDHLFLGTHADNTADMIRKGRAKGVLADPRAGQRKSAATRTRRTLEGTLPSVLAEIRARQARDEPTTFRACWSIAGYYAIRKRFNHSEILEMAKCAA